MGFLSKARYKFQLNAAKTEFDQSRLSALARSQRIQEPQEVDELKFKNAKLFFDRKSVISSFEMIEPTICEIGTLAGDFAMHMLSELKPKTMHLVDLFNAEDYFFNEVRFNPESHYQYVSSRFSENKNVILNKGLSFEVLSEFQESGKKFDFIYIDAGHTYPDVSRDLKLASKIIKPGGIIGMNDYIMTDYYYDTVYGVVQAVNEFLNNSNFTVYAYSLNRNLFSDIYLQKNNN